MVFDPEVIFDDVALGVSGGGSETTESDGTVVYGTKSIMVTMKLSGGSTKGTVAFYGRVHPSEEFDNSPFKTFTLNTALGQITREVSIGEGMHSVKVIAVNQDSVNTGVVRCIGMLAR